MKFKIVLAACLFTCAIASAQTSADFDKVTLEQKADYKTAEPQVLEATQLLLNNPIEKDNVQRLRATSFIMKWMTGTPDYTFALSEQDGKVFKKDLDITGLYFAAMVQACLQNPADCGNDKALRLQAYKLLIAYVSQPGNNAKPSKELKKLVEAEKDGKLEGALTSR